MDAKITKQRLSNFLSYEWLKILAVVAAAILAIVLVFTMSATNPTNAQTFTVYAYSDLRAGEDFYRLDDALESKGVFSYDILKIGTESFSDGGTYSGAAFAARRSAGEGTVMFASAYDTEGKPSQNSQIYANTRGNVYSGGSDYSGYYDAQFFLETEIKNYLIDFFGQDLNGALDEEKAAARFTERNGKDKRFRTKAQKEAGIAEEMKRLEKLRENFLAVEKAFQEEKLSYLALSTETGEIATFGWGGSRPEGYFTPAVSMSGLGNITKLVQYTADEKPTSESVGMLIFRNGAKKAFDLCFETVSFLNYLVGTYA